MPHPRSRPHGILIIAVVAIATAAIARSTAHVQRSLDDRSARAIISRARDLPGTAALPGVDDFVCTMHCASLAAADTPMPASGDCVNWVSLQQPISIEAA
jgi:hypothetical protein